MPISVLVVDDEDLVRWSLRQLLQGKGYAVKEAADGPGAEAAFRDGVDLVLLDIRLPGVDGLDLLKRLQAVDPDPPVVLVTAQSSVEGAVEAMQQGAFHYLTKPFNMDEVSALVDLALEHTRLTRELRRLREREREAWGATDVIGVSSAMQQVRRFVARVAASPMSTVFLRGESGTGKDLIATSIHRMSQRACGPFVNITCSALPETLLESELFGYERGAFTDARQQKKGLLEQAGDGTVFLDEIGETSPAFQAKLLRFLEEKAFRRVGGAVDVRPDIRVIAATNRDLDRAVASGEFREDLYYRLAVAMIELPPLREREGDSELLAKVFIERFNKEMGKHVKGLSPGASRMLCRHHWPGNVRELRNAVERAMLFADHDTLRVEDFEGISTGRSPSGTFKLPPGGIEFVELERDMVAQALELSHGNQTRAAALLGMKRDQIRYRMQKFGFDSSPGTHKVGEAEDSEEPASLGTRGPLRRVR